jgi:Rps23 Pro-64 3,4-dihydroxylase Tpa1-like proline 4-hydroxylase
VPIVLAKERLDGFAQRFAGDYARARPFPHAVIDGFLPEDVAEEVLGAFPSPEALLAWRQGDSTFQRRKQGSADIERFPGPLQDLVFSLNSNLMLEFLEKLTGIPKLISDPYLNGGGIHQISRGGFLKVHRDYLKHPRFNLDRRINLLLYLNKDWREDYGGHLELWDPQMSRCEARILPAFNRCVIFTTSETSYHGHPDPLTCPEGVTRKSVALYYYSTEAVSVGDSQDYNTPWVARPGEAFELPQAGSVEKPAESAESAVGGLGRRLARLVGLRR